MVVGLVAPGVEYINPLNLYFIVIDKIKCHFSCFYPLIYAGSHKICELLFKKDVFLCCENVYLGGKGVM